ncbi:MAG TPA: universal stress protein [Candidatus Acidoferrales bacterium]|nr:universal stress protein [Candidatus Acidoferrales bacterium]
MSTSRSESNTSSPSGPFHKILLALDLSEQTSRVIQLTSELTKILNAKILVCNVANVATSVAANDFDGLPANEDERKTLDTLKELIYKSLSGYPEKIEFKILHGDPAERLGEYAEYSACDLIVVGSRGHGELKKAILGSVSSSVAAKSKKSVLILK